MSQPDSRPQPKTDASADKPSDPKTSPKAGTNNQAASGSLRGFWYVILLLFVTAIFAGYRIQNSAEEPRPVVSAAEEEAVIAPETVGESSSTAPALVISSDVRGAEVYLNGNRVGMTPHKATPLAPGDYEVRIVHEGYETFEEQVHVETPDDAIHATLRPASSENNAPAATAAPADIRGIGDSIAVKHKHRIGSCEGVLRASDEGLRYDTEHKDAFLAAYSDVEELKLDGNELTLSVRDVRKYDFTEQSDNQEALVAFHERVDAAIPKTESVDN